MVMLVDPSNISFTQIKDEFRSYIDSKATADVWEDFYSSGVGATLIELLSGFATFNSYTITVGRRETYLFYALVRSAVVAIAESLGYSAFRGSNVHLVLNITPSTTQILTRMELLGTYLDYDIVAFEDQALVQSVPEDVQVMIGQLKTETIDIQSADLQIFRFESLNVSDDIRILINGSLVPSSKYISDLVNDKYLVLSNALGAVDVIYMNDGAYPYTYGDTITLEYLELKEFTIGVSDESSLQLDIGTINTVSTASLYLAPETTDALRINAPLYHETNTLIRGRDDFKNHLKLLISNAVSVNAYDVSAAVMDLSYVRDDLTLLTTTEKASILSAMDTYRPFGIWMPTITDPTQLDITLDIVLTLETSLGSIGQSTIEADVASIVSTWEKQLETSITLEDVEAALTALTYVKISRVTTSDSLDVDWDEYLVITTSISTVEL